MMDLGIENSRFLRRPLLVCVSKSAFYIKFIFAHLRNRGEVKSPINGVIGIDALFLRLVS